MQNKFLYRAFGLSFLICLGMPVIAQESGDFLVPTQQPEVAAKAAPTPSTAATGAIAPDLSGRQAVDFQARTSLDTLELTPLPGIYETNITGPAPLANSVSVKDMPSERLLGLLTPEVFKEMAELERDNTFLKLQIQKETMKNDLERLRANYRQARLDEIAKREDVVRTRIQWWQEQEKIRQEMEAQRAAADAAKTEQEENTALSTIAEPIKVPEEDDIPEEIEALANKEPQKATYALIDIVGTRNTLTARVKNIESGRISSIQTGDMLTDGSKVDEISPVQVMLIKNGQRVALTFEDM